MSFKQLLKRVEQNKEYKQFIKQNPEYYLAHCFCMLDDSTSDFKWEFGFYSEKKDKLVVFETFPEIKMRPEEDAFKKEGTIKKLDLNKVKVDVKKALKSCDGVVKSKYPSKSITKKIIVLQNTDSQLYNITLVTMSFDIVNIKIDANTGEVLSDNIQNIMNLGRRLGSDEKLAL